MRYSVLGTTGVKVSRVCLGTATFGVAPTAQDADRVVGAAVDLGINFVDTTCTASMPVFDRPGAPAAADHEPAEQILGRALRGRRDKMVVAEGRLRAELNRASPVVSVSVSFRYGSPPFHRVHRRRHPRFPVLVVVVQVGLDEVLT